MEANSEEGILYYKSYYERYGYKIILCEKCHRIKEISCPDLGVSGPSLSSGMFCKCKNK